MYSSSRILLCLVIFIYFCSIIQADSKSNSPPVKQNVKHDGLSNITPLLVPPRITASQVLTQVTNTTTTVTSTTTTTTGVTMATLAATDTPVTASTAAAVIRAMPVCDPNNNFGMNYAITVDAGPGGIPVSWTLITYDSITDGGGCCALCFDSAGCIMFMLNNSSQCVLYILTGSGSNNITPRCPLGTVSGTVSTPVPGWPPIGIGPCTTLDN